MTMQRVADHPTDIATTPTDNLIAQGQAVAAEQDAQTQYQDYKIIRRNGSVVVFEPQKISIAMTKAFLAVRALHRRVSAPSSTR
jgi:ribonucleoside-diphosphate reductase alpha chain